MNEKFLPILSTSILILLIIFSESTTAFNIQIFTDKKTYFKGSLVKLNVKIENIDEWNLIENISIEIRGLEEHNNITSLCILSSLDEGFHSECSQQDKRFVSVELKRENLDYGYGYGYYGYDITKHVELEILWSFEDLQFGNYEARVILFSENKGYYANTTFKIREKLGKVAFICRTDECNHGIEKSMISFLAENGWTVDAKGYWSWGSEIRNYKLIACSDELRACKIDGSHPAFSAHKSGIPFLEIADQPYVNAGWRFGYTKGYVGLTNNEELYITKNHQITSGFSGSVDVLIGSKFNVIPDDLLSSSVTDLADSGNHQSSTLFVANNYAYVGWFNEIGSEGLTDSGATIFNRILEWLTSESIESEVKLPKILEYSPIGNVNTRKPLIRILTDEKTVCKFSLNVRKPYESMDFEFPYNLPLHEYQIDFELPNNTYVVYARCKDLNGNELPEVSWFFKIDLPVYRDIAFICRTDECNHGIEKDTIRWLEERGWTVDAKGYWSWGSEIRNYKLIACSDELRACKIDGSHPAFSAHKSGIPFLEIADQPYVNAGWRFGYTKGYVGFVRSESLYITKTHQITQGLSGFVNIMNKPKFNVVQDYNLASSVTDLADSGNHQSSTLFVANNYAYVGWFASSTPKDLNDAGNLLFNKLVNWLVQNRI